MHSIVVDQCDFICTFIRVPSLSKLLLLVFLFTFTSVYAVNRRMAYNIFIHVKDSQNRPVRNTVFVFSNTNSKAFRVSTDALGNFDLKVSFILPCTSGNNWSLETIIEQCESYNGSAYRLYSEDKMALLPNTNYKNISLENLSIPNDTLVFKLRDIDRKGKDNYFTLLNKL